MSSDGATQGIKPTDALKVILGGQDEADQPHMTPEQVRDMVMATNLSDINYSSDDGYDMCCRWVARQIVEYEQKHPGALALEDDIYKLIKADMKEGGPEWEMLTSITGFQWGWALNTARMLNELDPVPNPAIVTVNVYDEDDLG